MYDLDVAADVVPLIVPRCYVYYAVFDAYIADSALVGIAVLNASQLGLLCWLPLYDMD
jgi:hypothetical protein